MTATVPLPGAAVVVMGPPEDKEVKKEDLKPAACFLPKSIVIPIEKGRMVIEPWQEVFLMDYTPSGRRREFRVQVFWEPKESDEK